MARSNSYTVCPRKKTSGFHSQNHNELPKVCFPGIPALIICTTHDSSKLDQINTMEKENETRMAHGKLISTLTKVFLESRVYPV